MRQTIKTFDIPKDILDQEQCEDIAYFEYLCEESNAVNALEFFEIIWDPDKHSISIPEAFDFEDAIKTVNDYLEYVEEDSVQEAEHFNPRSKLYDEHTESSRGADDGTFDYAGTFVISILCVLQEYCERLSK